MIPSNAEQAFTAPAIETWDMGSSNTKLKERCFFALKRSPFGLLLKMGSICV